MVMHILRYNSLDDFSNAEISSCNAWLSKKMRGEYASYALRQEMMRWYGEERHPESIDADLKRYGYQKGVKRLEECIDQIRFDLPRVSRYARRPVRSHFGDELDIHQVISGNHDRSWRSTQKDKVRGGRKLVRIWGNPAAPAYVLAKDMFWGPALACLLVEAFKKKGASVELMAYLKAEQSYANGDDVHIEVKVSPSHRPLTLLKAATMCHPSFVRIWGFRAIGSVNQTCLEGLGAPIMRPNPKDFKRKSGMANIFLPQVFSLEDAVKEAKSILVDAETLV